MERKVEILSEINLFLLREILSSFKPYQQRFAMSHPSLPAAAAAAAAIGDARRQPLPLRCSGIAPHLKLLVGHTKRVGDRFSP